MIVRFYDRSRFILEMAAASFSLLISYSQVAVFDSALEHPFNLWTERHVQQGFSWRPGSVSFATLEEAGQHDIEIDVVPDDVALSPEAIRIIQTPFEVPQSGSIELARFRRAYRSVWLLDLICFGSNISSQPAVLNLGSGLFSSRTELLHSR